MKNKSIQVTWLWLFVTIIPALILQPGAAQTPPSEREYSDYRGIFAAVLARDSKKLSTQIRQQADIDERDGYGRSALHVASYIANHQAMRLLVAAGADPNALEHDRYDIVTIAAVANDLATMTLALKLGCRADNVTSRYDGTALIAAAHLGHAEIVNTLIRAGAPLDHVNNLNWTALIESIVLGNGGERHTETLRLLVEAGANVNLSEFPQRTPLALARDHGYKQMVQILLNAGAK